MRRATKDASCPVNIVDAIQNVIQGLAMETKEMNNPSILSHHELMEVGILPAELLVTKWRSRSGASIVPTSTSTTIGSCSGSEGKGVSGGR